VIIQSNPGYARRGVRSTIDDNLISFINVIFLIVIFFMIAGRLERPSVFDINPPISTSNTERQETLVQIELSIDGTLAVDGSEVKMVGLIEIITQLKSQSDQMLVEIRADANVRMQHLNNLLQKIKANGVRKVTVLSIPRD